MFHRLLILTFAGSILLFSACTKPSDDTMEENLAGDTWRIEYFDVYHDDSDQDDESNGGLDFHWTNAGQITFTINRTGTITDSAYSVPFNWHIDNGILVFDFQSSANVANAHPIVDYAFSSGCDPDVKTYNILKSTSDMHIFRFFRGGSCNLETFQCIEWAITR